MKDVEMTGIVKLPELAVRFARRQASVAIAPRSRSRRFALVQNDNPTKELDALMLGNTLVGYGGNMSLNNIAIMENLMTMAVMEANDIVRDEANSAAWYAEFVKCLSELGCFFADTGYTQYSEKSTRVDAQLVIKDIVKGILDGVAASTPAATVLGAVATATIDGLKHDKDSLNLFNSQVKTPKGARFSMIPCEELANGILIAASTCLKEAGNVSNGGVLFVDWQTSAREMFRGKSFITFNPAKYAGYKEEIESYLGEHRKEVLTKRFNRRKA